MICLNAYENKPCKYILVICYVNEEIIIGYWDGNYWKDAITKEIIEPIAYSMLPNLKGVH